MPDPERATSAASFLSSLGARVHDRFVESRTLLSFEEYLDLFGRSPRLHARSAAQYLRDAMDHFGTDEIDTPVGKMRRFRLFDGQIDGPGGVRVAGQEEIQNAIYRQIGNFVRAGRVNKLLMLHGPNGSAKTSILGALEHAMAVYSRTPEGARYRFNWVFPSEKLVKGSVGFGAGGKGSKFETYAHLDSELVESRIGCDFKDSPLFLIPQEERLAFLQSHGIGVSPTQQGVDDFVLSDYMRDGTLCHKCRSIFRALLAHYGGDLLRVFRHVQVERFQVSRRDLSAAAVVEPQLSVDAELRQVTADRNIASLPPALQNVVLYEAGGALVAGNRGLVEFSDLLKRPLEAYKYLLGTVETAQVPLGPFAAQLDVVLVATSNEKHLSAFKEIPDFASFKGRIELIRVPYLRRRSVEQQIYDAQLSSATVGKHIAPHATQVAATWAVLTRLRKPLSERYKGPVRVLIDALTPAEKLRLYDEGKAPERLPLAAATDLRASAPALYRETDAIPLYEGRLGASAREIKTVLLNASQNADFACLDPQAVLHELTELVRDPSVYEFLQQERVDGFHAHGEFVQIVEAEYLDRVDDEVRSAMGLVGEEATREALSRYIQNIAAWLKGETILNRITGQSEKVDEQTFAELEQVIAVRGQDRREFRRGMVAQIAAFKLDHPDAPLDYAAIFPDLVRKMRDHAFEERRRLVRRYKDDLLRYWGGEVSQLTERDRAHVESTLRALRERFGYCDHCARTAVLFLFRRRYSDERV